MTRFRSSSTKNPFESIVRLMVERYRRCNACHAGHQAAPAWSLLTHSILVVASHVWSVPERKRVSNGSNYSVMDSSSL